MPRQLTSSFPAFETVFHSVAWNSWSSCLTHPSSIGITGLCHHTVHCAWILTVYFHFIGNLTFLHIERGLVNNKINKQHPRTSQPTVTFLKYTLALKTGSHKWWFETPLIISCIRFWEDSELGACWLFFSCPHLFRGSWWITVTYLGLW